jgi:hypothetical protein
LRASSEIGRRPASREMTCISLVPGLVRGIPD